MSADTRERPIDRFARMRGDFRVWRGERPFWGGMLTLLAGVPIMYFPYHSLSMGAVTLRLSTTAGAGSLIIGVLLVVLGLTMWFQRHSRVFAGVAAILLALVSLVVSNFGGFLIGFLLGLIGGGLCLAWAPGEPVSRSAQADGEQADGKDADAEVVPSPTGTTSAGTGSALDDLSVNNANGRHRAG